jgi:hypothetical protein
MSSRVDKEASPSSTATVDCPPFGQSTDAKDLEALGSKGSTIFKDECGGDTVSNGSSIGQENRPPMYEDSEYIPYTITLRLPGQISESKGAISTHSDQSEAGGTITIHHHGQTAVDLHWTLRKRRLKEARRKKRGMSRVSPKKHGVY